MPASLDFFNCKALEELLKKIGRNFWGMNAFDGGSFFWQIINYLLVYNLCQPIKKR